ncbi:hypothetical protein NL108_017892 [Boleophthalmus pectinirostris]|uniref:zinc finger protein 771-like n=1 Tax=Boleophthalmus pectinirostris TaxID=150288 RepID=UPI00242E33CC|nr:zinc finger protein 771-like [Boleophthalmus pectinirostris]KAJ0065762.1 hypothetical protein NL108_017892 [Boleophthalmus pectinirostris]
MSDKGQIFRALVTERLSAAAEEICALFERTVAEYEEELWRSKREESRRREPRTPRLLLQTGAAEELRSPGSRADVPRPHAPSDVKVKSATEEEEEEEEECRGYDENDTQTTIIKEEFIKQEEEEQLQDFSFFSGKNDEDGEHTDHEDDWEAPCSSSFRRGEAEPEVDYFSQVYMQALERSGQNPNRTPAARQPKCPECDQEFDLKEDLQTHMLEVHGGDKPISCPVCARTFTRNGSLKLHMAMHMHEKPYSCPVCNRGFTQKGNLRSHMAQHTGEKPFSCSECDARFPIKRTLLRHMKLHTGERPYSCPYCDKSFTRKEHVRLHMAVHTGQATPKKRRVMPTRSERDGADTSNDSSGAGFYGGGANE